MIFFFFINLNRGLFTGCLLLFSSWFQPELFEFLIFLSYMLSVPVRFGEHSVNRHASVRPSSGLSSGQSLVSRPRDQPSGGCACLRGLTVISLRSPLPAGRRRERSPLSRLLATSPTSLVAPQVNGQLLFLLRCGGRSWTRF